MVDDKIALSATTTHNSSTVLVDVHLLKELFHRANSPESKIHHLERGSGSILCFSVNIKLQIFPSCDTRPFSMSPCAALTIGRVQGSDEVDIMYHDLTLQRMGSDR